jgi:hypothetical protein
VELADRIVGNGLLSPADTGRALTDTGQAKLAELGIDPGPLLRSRRILARPCLDWTQRRPHLAGAHRHPPGGTPTPWTPASRDYRGWLGVKVMRMRS